MGVRNDDSVVYLGNQLDVDLWFKGNVDQTQSVLIRTTTPEGVVKSAFMHIDGEVRQIPVFQNEDPLVLEEQPRTSTTPNKTKYRMHRTGDISSPTSIFTKVIRTAAGLVALLIAASLLAGLFQLRVVLTGSMKPTINPGDLVIAGSTKFMTPEVNKIVLYSARDLDGKAVTVWAHRIIAGNANVGFTIKGDANAQPDINIVPITDIQSVVITKLPKVGRLFNPVSLILIFSGFMALTLVLKSRRAQL